MTEIGKSPCEECKRSAISDTCNCKKFQDWFPKAWDEMCEILRKKWGENDDSERIFEADPQA